MTSQFAAQDRAVEFLKTLNVFFGNTVCFIFGFRGCVSFLQTKHHQGSGHCAADMSLVRRATSKGGSKL